jgi:multidrug efflux pump subunit AcrB
MSKGKMVRRRPSPALQTAAVVMSALLLANVFLPVALQSLPATSQRGQAFTQLRLEIEVSMRGLSQQIERAGMEHADVFDRVATVPIKQVLGAIDYFSRIDPQLLASRKQVSSIRDKLERTAGIFASIREIKHRLWAMEKIQKPGAPGHGKTTPLKETTPSEQMEELLRARAKLVGELKEIAPQLQEDLRRVEESNRGIRDILPGDKGAPGVQSDRLRFQEQKQTQRQRSRDDNPKVLSRASTASHTGRHR